MRMHWGTWGFIIACSVGSAACARPEPSSNRVVPPKLSDPVAVTAGRVDDFFGPSCVGWVARGASHRVAVHDGAAAVSLGGNGTPAATFETTRVQRGTTDGGVRVVQEHPAGNSMVVDRGSVTESFENRESGVEQRWLFSTAPAGSGSLSVHVSVRGATYAGSSAGGLDLRLDTGTPLHYGVGTWIDARGRSTLVSPAWRSGEIVLEVPADVIASSRFPAVLDPLIGPPRRVDDPVIVSVGKNPAVAVGSGGYLVAWVDSKNSSFSSTPSGSYRTDTLRVSRVAADGRVLEASGGIALRESTTGGVIQGAVPRAMAAWVKDRFLVGWDGGSSSSGWVQFVMPDGTVGGPPAMLPPPTLRALVSVGAESAAVLWTGSSGAEFSLLANDGSIVNHHDDDVGFRALTWSGSEFLAVGVVGSQLLGRRLDATGVPIDAVPFSIASTVAGFEARVAWSGSAFFVGWTDPTNGPSVTTVATDGTVAPSPLTLGSVGANGALESIVAEPSSIALTWRQITTPAPPYPAVGELDLTRLALDGSVLGTTTVRPGLQAPGASTSARIGTERLVVFDGAGVVGQRTLEDGAAAGDALQIGSRYQGQFYPTIAAGNGEFLVVWSEVDGSISGGMSFPDGGAVGRAVAARLDSSGTPRDPEGIALPFRGNVGWDGQDFLVSVETAFSPEYASPGAVRVTNAGALLDSTKQSFPSTVFASDGHTILSAAGATFDQSLAKLDSTAAPVPGSVLDLAWDGTRYVATYAPTPSETAIAIALFSPSKRLIASGPVGSEARRNVRGSSHVAGGAGLDFVIWRSGDGHALAEVRANDLKNRIGRLISLGEADEVLGSSWDGTQFLALWRRDKRLLAARISTAAEVLDSGGFEVAPDVGTGGSLASTPDGTTVFAYTTHDPAAGGDRASAAFRVFTRVLVPSGSSEDGGVWTTAEGGSTYLDAAVGVVTTYPFDSGHPSHPDTGAGGSSGAMDGSSRAPDSGVSSPPSDAQAEKPDASSPTFDASIVDSSAGSGGTPSMDGALAAGGAAGASGGTAIGGVLGAGGRSSSGGTGNGGATDGDASTAPRGASPAAARGGCSCTVRDARGETRPLGVFALALFAGRLRRRRDRRARV